VSVNGGKSLYRVTHKSLRDFQPLRYNNRDGHDGGSCQQRERHSKFLWFCVVHGPKPPLHCHNWLSFGKLQDTERLLIPCPSHVSSLLPYGGETCKYATAPITQKNLERFSTYWYAPFCCVFMVVALPNSEVTERLMNYLVYYLTWRDRWQYFHAGHVIHVERVCSTHLMEGWVSHRASLDTVKGRRGSAATCSPTSIPHSQTRILAVVG
jgi:hypothetical protein